MRYLRSARMVCVLAFTAVSVLTASVPAPAHSAERSAASAKKQKISVSKRVRVTTSRATARVMRQMNRPGTRALRLKKSYNIIPAPASAAQLQGLRGGIPDALSLQSSVALVIEQDSSQVLFSKNPGVALPIASITKLMTALVVLEANQSLDEAIEINESDLDTEKGTGSRLKFGTVLSRRDMLRLALMSSENRAAHALGRNYPGGLNAFVQAMNAKARLLNMHSTQFVDPTGLSSRNVASAEDLARLVRATSQNPTIRAFSTYPGYAVQVGGRTVEYRNTNALVNSAAWDIALQKTGYISEAGKCLVMQAVIKGKNVVIVLLDSVGKYSRFGDANRIKKWMEANGGIVTASVGKTS